MKIEQPYRTISFPKCPYCKHELNPDLWDSDYGKMVALADGSGSRDVVVKCKQCGFKYRVSVTIRFNASGIKEQNNEQC